jgi:hypothetical protein
MCTKYEHYPKLIASLTTTLPRLVNLDEEEIERQLINNGYTFFWMRGALIDQLYEEGVSVHADDHHSFLACYKHLEKLIALGEPYEHNGYIGEGSLITIAFSDGKDVKLEMNCCPGANLANSRILKVTLPETEYIQWWRSLAYQIVECSKTPHPRNSQVNA